MFGLNVFKIAAIAVWLFCAVVATDFVQELSTKEIKVGNHTYVMPHASKAILLGH